MSEIEVKLVGSPIGEPKALRKIIWSLGLRKVGAVRRFKDNNCTRGALNRVQHLVRYSFPEASGAAKKGGK